MIRHNRGMFWSLDIDPPKAERFIWNLVLEIWDFTILKVLLIQLVNDLS